MTTWSQVNESDEEQHTELRATFQDFAQIIDEWRGELADCASFEDTGTACTTCGNTESAKRQLQDVLPSVNKQLVRLNQLQEIAATLERDILAVVDKSKQHIDRMAPRVMLVERAILCDTNAKRAIIENRARNVAVFFILEAAICTFVPDSSVVDEDEEKKRQLKSLRSHIEFDGSDVKGFLRDSYTLEDDDFRTTEFSHEKMAERIRTRIRRDLCKYQQDAKKQAELVDEVIREESTLEGQKRGGKGVSTASGSKQEVRRIEDRLRMVKLDFLSLRAEQRRLESLVYKLKSGWEFAEDDNLFKSLIVNGSDMSFPRDHSQEYVDNMLRYAAQTSDKTLAKMIDILYGDGMKEFESTFFSR